MLTLSSWKPTFRFGSPPHGHGVVHLNTKRPGRTQRTSIPADWDWDMSRMGYWRLSYQRRICRSDSTAAQRSATSQHTGGLGSIEPCASSSRSPTQPPEGRGRSTASKREETNPGFLGGSTNEPKSAAAVREGRGRQDFSKSRTRGPPVSHTCCYSTFSLQHWTAVHKLSTLHMCGYHRSDHSSLIFYTPSKKA